MGKSIPITDFKDLDKIFTGKKQNRDKAKSDLRKVHALDTETWQGNIFLIADSDGKFLDNITPESVINFLFNKKYQGSWNFFYHLEYDAEVILKLLENELFSYKKNRKLRFKFKEFTLEYIPNKCLKIRKRHHSSVFYDIAQFYNGKSLVKAYQENIRKLDDEYLKIKEKRDEFSPSFYNHNKKMIRNYCIKDCTLTKELSEKWVKLFHKAFGFYSLKWYSSGYLAERVLINHGVAFPTFDSIPYEIQKMAYRSYVGGRFEMLKRGFIGTAHLYDINSAYPDAIRKIPDLSKGKWIRSKSIHPDSKMGFFRIRANIPDNEHIPPFPFRIKNNIIFTSGKFETYVTLEELQVCKDARFYKILDSYQFISRSKTYPYKEFIEKMYQKRLELKRKNDPMQLPIKIILNSIYGKTGQKINWIIGNLFNPVIFSFITGYARAQLYRFVQENNIERQVVAFATDSIGCTKKLDVDSDKLGEFSFDGSADDVFFLQNGFYRFNRKWKQRGFGKLSGKDIEHLETFEKDGKLFYKIRIMRNSRLRSSIIQNKISEIGKIKEVTKQFNLNADRKRLWLGKIESMDSKVMNESMPISLNHFDKTII
ncbi:Type B DNA polymerase [Nitrosotalea devaniterrae]|uniref:DNA-directed DNA polymerase n=1 Tax=Nitrosotalea devaniterrae TaxID=1078905 RepID=A0A128A2S3_9ARCH|nr:Type B DNA polymerase [Candidatus Nitrosotalea devanaterra]